jgi:Ca2+-binding RTX toxin-like protein
VNLGTGLGIDGWNGLTGLLALGGTDTLSNIENVEGSNFNDTLTGDGGANELRGLAGDDTLEGGPGNDTLDGGAGSDTASYANATGGVTVSLLLSGSAQNTVNAGSDTLISIENLTGSAFVDVLTGDASDNVFRGGAGNDTLNGGDGLLDSAIYAGIRNDYTLSRSGETVTVTSVGAGITDGVDTLTSVERLVFADGVLLAGTLGDDTLLSGQEDETIDGSAGIDTASYATATAAVTVSLAKTGAQNTGGGGIDILVSIENLGGSAFNDKLTGNDSVNTLDGGGGNDILDGGKGADVMVGGQGGDTYLVDNAGDVVDETTGASFRALPIAAGGIATLADTVKAAVSYSLNYLAAQGVENLTLIAGKAKALNGTGNDRSNALVGNALGNKLDGGAGNDMLNGGAGNDTLIGGAGNDTASYADAKVGVTVKLVTTAQKTVGAGTDKLDKSIENLTGSAKNDTLTGNTGNNILDGAAGDDKLIGGKGNDTYVVNSTKDAVTEAAGSSGGTDLAQSTATLYTLAENVENLILMGSANIKGTGNALNNTLTGNDGNNDLNGGAGNDTLKGLAGADVLTGGAGNDTFDFDAVSDSTPSTSDTIKDFKSGDKVDLSTIDANASTGANDSFTFIGPAAFGEDATGQLRFDAANHLVLGSTDADSDAEFSILLTGVNSMTGANFVL